MAQIGTYKPFLGRVHENIVFDGEKLHGPTKRVRQGPSFARLANHKGGDGRDWP